MGKFSSRDNALKLYNEINNWHLYEGLTRMAEMMRTSKANMTQEEKDQLIAVSNDPNFANDLSRRQDQQIQKVESMIVYINNLKYKLARYNQHTTFARNQDALQEQSEWAEIQRDSNALKTLLEEYKREGCLFPLDNEDIMFKASWMAEKITKEFSQKTSGNLDLSKKNGALEINCNVGKTDLSNYQLFPHNPDPEDLTQGYVGDCFMHASLYNIAKIAPDAIRDCMTINPDNKSVTVRLYGREEANGKLKPVYVTVPMKEGEDLTKGSMWTAALETAMAATGMAMPPYGIIKKDTDIVNVEEESLFGLRTKIVQKTMAELRQDITKYTPSLVHAGDATEFAEWLLGERKGHNAFKIADRGIEHTKRVIADALATDKQITCGTPDKGPDSQKDKNHISYHHDYVITEMDNDGLWLRNPHNNKAAKAKENEAKFYIKFDTFLESFENVSVVEIPDRFKRLEPPVDSMPSFRNILQGLTDALGKQDSFILRTFYNSDAFNNLRTGLGELNAMAKSENVTQQELQTKATAVLTQVAAYEERCRTVSRKGGTRECRVDITKGIKQICNQIKKGFDDPTAEFERFKTELAAEKIAKGVNKQFENELQANQGMKKEDLLKMPIFKKMIKEPGELDRMCFGTTSKKVKNMMQVELKKAQQEFAAGRVRSTRPEQPQNAGPEVQPNLH